MVRVRSTAVALVSVLLICTTRLGGAYDPQYYPDSCQSMCSNPADYITQLPSDPSGSGSKPTQWGEVAIVQARDNLEFLSPPGVARALALVSTCMYDAASLFDYVVKPYGVAGFARVGCTYPDLLNTAIDGAAYTALTHIFNGFGSAGKVQDALYRIGDASIWDLSTFVVTMGSGLHSTLAYGALTSQITLELSNPTALEVGSLACKEVIRKFQEDGFDGVGRPWQGYSGFAPANLPQYSAGVTNCAAEIRDLDRWQQICTPTSFRALANVGTTECSPQSWLAPEAGTMTAFVVPGGGSTEGTALMDAVAGVDSSVTGYPPKFHEGTTWHREMMEVVGASGNLDDGHKLIAEYWADGPDFASPPGTWYRIAVNAAISRGMGSMESAQLLMLVGMAVNDAGVASWRVKRTFDSIRPLQMVQCGFPEDPYKEILAWKGPYQGVGYMPAARWQPYQLDTFKTPPFAGYVSGHATFSAAAGEMLKLYFGSDDYVGPRCKHFAEGSSLFEKKIAAGESGCQPGLTDVPNSGKDSVGYAPRSDVTLCWNSFSEAYGQSAESRIYGGIHVRTDNTDGAALGIEIAKAVYRRGMDLIGKPVDMYTVF